MGTETMVLDVCVNFRETVVLITHVQMYLNVDKLVN